MSTKNKFVVGQTVVHKKEETTIQGVNMVRGGKAYQLANGEVAKAKDLSKPESKVEEGVIPEAFPLPTREEVIETDPKKTEDNARPEKKEVKDTSSKK